MKKLITLILTILCLIGFAACEDHSVQSAKAITNSQSVTVYVDEANKITYFGKLASKALYDGSGNENGFYSLHSNGRYTNILYTDYETHKQIVLCNRPECKHDNESCTGYEGEGANIPYILALANKLVFIYPGNPYYYEELGKAVLPRIDVSDLNGANKKTVVTFGSEIKVNLDNIAYDEENLYLLQEIVHIESEDIFMGLQFQQVNLVTGETKCIAEFSDLDKQNIYFLGTSENLFIFKRITNGELDESVQGGREQWDEFLAGQIHEIFTINKQCELSDALVSYPQDTYFSYVCGNRIILIKQDTSIVAIDPETGEEEKIVAELPYENALLYGHIKSTINNWLIVDLIAKEDVPNIRYAINVQTKEYNKLTLSTQVDGLVEHYIVYAQVKDQILVRTAQKMDEFDVTLPDGSVVTNPRIVDEWALMKIEDYLNNNNVFMPIEAIKE